MADSVHLQILKAVLTRLQASSVTIDGETFTPPAGLQVERERIGDVTPRVVESGPLVVVHMGEQQPTTRPNYKAPAVVRTMELNVTVAALANDVFNSEAVDPATNWIVQSLQSEPTLGLLTHWISEEGSEDFYTMFEESQDVLAYRQMKLHFRFHTRTDNPERRA